jgi:hypothetical protein
MLTNDPAVEFLAWLLFSLVLAWTLRQGLPQLLHWCAQDAGGCEDIYFFPDEVGCEREPRGATGSGGETDPRGARRRHGEPTRT